MAIYGNTISFGGGGGTNDTLPPLLDNFKATRLEGGLVPPVSNAVAFKDIPDGSKIKLVKGSNISGTVTYGKTTDLNHRIVFDSNDWTKKEFQLENDSSHTSICDSDIDRWLNSTKASDWWGGKVSTYAPERPTGSNTTPPDYANEQGFLYQLGITDEILAQNFNNIQINSESTAKVGLPWTRDASEVPYTFFNPTMYEPLGKYIQLFDNFGGTVTQIEVPRTRVVERTPLAGAVGMLFPMMEPKPETKVALDVDGSYYMFENQSGSIVLSADKMEESRATDLAGAVWVYGDHIPQNKNDGTKIELARDEIVLPKAENTDIPPISYSEIERAEETTTWSAPEDGYYKFIGVAEGGRSGAAQRDPGGINNVSGGSGGSGGIVASVFKLKRSESVSLAISGNVTITRGSETASATAGGSGGYSISASSGTKIGIYGKPGTATGGNLANINGEPGSPGKMLEGNKTTLVRGGEIVYEKYRSIGAHARTTMRESEVVSPDKGTDAYVVILKGDEEKEDPSFRVVDRTVEWDSTKDLYARQFTYNAKKHYQTSMAGAIAFLSRPTLRIGDLPSKSVVRLGRYGGNRLTWWTAKDKQQKQYLVFTPESTKLSPFNDMAFDTPEPSNPNTSRQTSGNNNYSLSNIHQWLNTNKSKEAWYTKTHTYDEPPPYTNQNGFLRDWSNDELSVLINKKWLCKKPLVDGGETETLVAKVALMSKEEVGLDSEATEHQLDIFNSEGDRAAGKTYELRSPVLSSSAVGSVNIDIVMSGGASAVSSAASSFGIRPIVSVSPDTPVYEQPNEDGSYNICLTSPDDFESASSKVYVYSDTAPTNKSLMWIQKGSNVLYVHNGTNWMPITGVYGGGN